MKRKFRIDGENTNFSLGIFDQDGVEVYEDDLLEFHDGALGVVKYSPECVGYSARHPTYPDSAWRHDLSFCKLARVGLKATSANEPTFGIKTLGNINNNLDKVTAYNEKNEAIHKANRERKEKAFSELIPPSSCAIYQDKHGKYYEFKSNGKEYKLYCSLNDCTTSYISLHSTENNISMGDRRKICGVDFKVWGVGQSLFPFYKTNLRWCPEVGFIHEEQKKKFFQNIQSTIV